MAEEKAEMLITSTVHCNKCSNMISFTRRGLSFTKGELIDRIRKQQWSYGKEVLCSNCNGRASKLKQY